MNSLGRNIKFLRKQEKYSQKDLAEMLEVSQTSVAHYEAGTRQPTIETLMTLSQIFDESIDALVGHERVLNESNEEVMSEVDLVEAMIEALVQKDETVFFQLYEDHVVSKYDTATIIDVIFRSVLYEIGTLWMDGVITEADEHYATNIIRKTTNYMSVQNNKYIKDRIAITFSVSSEKHTLGIEMVNTYLETLGVKAIYLGSDLPIRSLEKVITDYQPAYVFISVTLFEHFNNLAHIVDYINEKFPGELLIGLGGQGIRDKSLFEKYENVHLINSMSELKEFVALD